MSALSFDLAGQIHQEINQYDDTRSTELTVFQFQV